MVICFAISGAFTLRNSTWKFKKKSLSARLVDTAELMTDVGGAAWCCDVIVWIFSMFSKFWHKITFFTITRADQYTFVYQQLLSSQHKLKIRVPSSNSIFSFIFDRQCKTLPGYKLQMSFVLKKKFKHKLKQ